MALQPARPSSNSIVTSRASAGRLLVFLAGNIVYAALNFMRCENIALRNTDTPKYLYAIRYAIGIGVCMFPIMAYIF